MQIKDNLIPSKLEGVLYGVLAMVIIFIGNLSHLTETLLEGTEASTGFSQGLIGEYTDRFLQFLDNLAFVPSSAVFIFWSLAGIAVFSILQSVYAVYLEIRNDVDISTHFLHPSNYIRWQFWADVFLQLVAHVSLYALVILWASLTGYVLMPIAVIFAREFSTEVNLNNAMSFISSFILLYVGAVIFALILKLFFKRKQLII